MNYRHLVRHFLTPIQEEKRVKPLFNVIENPSPKFISWEDGVLTANAHKAQKQAFDADERFVLVLAGSRSGKTANGPFWLLKEMMRKGPGDYLAVAPSFKILEKGIYKAFRRVFCSELRLGRIIGGASGHFTVSERGHNLIWPDIPYNEFEPSRVVFGHAASPDSLEAAEYKAAWLDEAGQKNFKESSWEAINRRLAIDEGRALLTTTPYMLSHWIKTEIFDSWKRRGTVNEQPKDKNYRVVSFESRANPLFPMDEWERAKATLPTYKFDLFYRGILTRPPGQIYDCFNPALADGVNGGMVYDPKRYFHRPEKWIGEWLFHPPNHWPRYVGIDFGAPNFAATFFAAEMIPDPDDEEKEIRSGRLVLYREYRPRESRTSREHVVELMRGEDPALPEMCAGGSKSEGQWRLDFADVGYPILEPDQPDVEVGISRVYAQIKSGGFRMSGGLMVSSDCKETLDQLANYVRETDEAGEVLDSIEDKDSGHLVDSMRYVISRLRSVAPEVDVLF